MELYTYFIYNMTLNNKIITINDNIKKIDFCITQILVKI